jgi:Large eukaryotic DNA virus major capsid protein/Major capsid protein N-terminus
MPGGLMQLLVWGNQNLYINGNPSITYFKKVYKTHTNFSMESIRVSFNRNDINIYETTTLKATIDRHGDMVHQIYLVFELPDIEFDEYLFKWIDNVGEAFIESAQISVNGNVIDKQTGEFKHLYNNLTYGVDKKFMLEKMTGHRRVPEQKVSYTPYGAIIEPYGPKYINSRKLYVPMNFWLNRSIGHSLPLCSLQYSEVELTIELRPITSLYKIFHTVEGVTDFFAPNTELVDHRLNQFVNNNKKRYLISDTLLDIKAYLEVNYIFLDKPERRFFIYNPIEYLIEQTSIINKLGVSESSVHDLVLQNPVKEIIWVCSRNDKRKRNDWFVYTDGDDHIMHSAKLLFNGIDRFDEKDATYFNFVQPFQHHRANYKDGLYVYSFAINADDVEQPSGACNCSLINKIQMYMTTRAPDNDTYAYDVTFYAISYNLLRIEKGLASVAFAK